MVVLEGVWQRVLLLTTLAAGGLACQGSPLPGEVSGSATDSGAASFDGSAIADAGSSVQAALHPPEARRAGSRPAGVPADFVPTPNGYFHPSCLVTLAKDEVLGRDLAIRDLDGSVRRTVASCAYPRYSAAGIIIPAENDVPKAAVEPAPSLHPLAAFYDGWVASYWYVGAVPPGVTLTGKWVVPPSPSSDPTSGSDPVTIYYFDDVEMQVGSAVDILQPVLGWGSPWGNQWTLTSWNCCTSGIQATSAAVDVSPGDVIEGITAGTNCDATSTCQTWTVTAKDLTTGVSSVLNTTEPSPPNIVNSAVLETYGVTACTMFPPGGEETFYDTTVTSADGGVVPLSYYFSAGASTGSPACDYAATSSGDSYTLIYSATPTVDATTTALIASPTTAVAGASVTLTATVTSSATSPAMAGNITFQDGTTVLGIVDVAPAVDGSGHEIGTASLPVSTLAVGTHTLTATFGGDDTYTASTSPATNVDVTKVPTTTSLAAAGASAVSEGTSIVVTATVTGGGAGTDPTPTGSIVFTNGTGGLGTVALAAGTVAGTATASVTLASVATYAVGAAYSGDTEYAASSASPLTASVDSTVSISPKTSATSPKGAVVFAATGTVGAVTWKLQTNASGGQVDGTGHYTAGSVANVTDVVSVTDSLDGGATANVKVGPAGGGQDAGAGSGDAGSPGSVDAGSTDDTGGSSGSGCGCSEAGRIAWAHSWMMGALGVLLLSRRRGRKR